MNLSRPSKDVSISAVTYCACAWTEGRRSVNWARIAKYGYGATCASVVGSRGGRTVLLWVLQGDGEEVTADCVYAGGGVSCELFRYCRSVMGADDC